MSPKVHLLLHHIHQFIYMTQMISGLFSEEVVEELHLRFFLNFKSVMPIIVHIIETPLPGIIILLYNIIHIIFKRIPQIKPFVLGFWGVWSAFSGSTDSMIPCTQLKYIFLLFRIVK